MASESILSQIDAEIERLLQVRKILANAKEISVKLDGRTAKKSALKSKAAKKRVLSPEARKRIADAQRKRWAAHRAGKKSK